MTLNNLYKYMYIDLQVSELLAYLDQHFPLQPHDWLLTGTPEGVGALKEGDMVQASVSHQGKVLSQGEWKVQASQA